jgi:hypothetical protein
MNNGREKETMVKWVVGRKRNENKWVVKRVMVGKARHWQGWAWRRINRN